jgi:hypothetical protein
MHTHVTGVHTADHTADRHTANPNGDQHTRQPQCRATHLRPHCRPPHCRAKQQTVNLEPHPTAKRDDRRASKSRAQHRMHTQKPGATTPTGCTPQKPGETCNRPTTRSRAKHTTTSNCRAKQQRTGHIQLALTLPTDTPPPTLPADTLSTPTATDTLPTDHNADCTSDRHPANYTADLHTVDLHTADRHTAGQSKTVAPHPTTRDDWHTSHRRAHHQMHTIKAGRNMQPTHNAQPCKTRDAHATAGRNNTHPMNIQLPSTLSTDTPPTTPPTDTPPTPTETDTLLTDYTAGRPSDRHTTDPLAPSDTPRTDKPPTTLPTGTPPTAFPTATLHTVTPPTDRTAGHTADATATLPTPLPTDTLPTTPPNDTLMTQTVTDTLPTDHNADRTPDQHATNHIAATNRRLHRRSCDTLLVTPSATHCRLLAHRRTAHCGRSHKQSTRSHIQQPS